MRRRPSLRAVAIYTVVGVITFALPAGAAARASKPSTPGKPAAVRITGASKSSLSVSWFTPTTGSRATGYAVTLAGRAPVTLGGNKRGYRFINLDCGTSYTIGVTSTDSSNRRSTKATVTGTTLKCDGTPPAQDPAPTTPPSPPTPPNADTTAPDTSIATSPAATTTATSAGFTFTSTETGSTFTCALDAGAPVSCTSPKSYGGLGLGSHTFSVRATDPAGNADPTPRAYTWTITMVTPPPTSPPGTCDRSATNASTLATQFAAASGGQTICLATGNYGSFTGSAKSGMVTLRALDGATVNLDVNFRGARNITLDGLTIAEALMYDTTQQITIRNSRFTGFVIIDGVANADILLDHNTHVDIDTCSGCWAGRISLPYGSATPSGVTVQNSTFRGGNADGIQAATGLSIIGNEFDHIDENGPNDQAHTDAIQILGASDVLVKGNYIHDSADGVVAYDGIDHATIEDNVIDLITGRWGIELYSDDSSIIRHNTLRYATTCSFSPCGHIMVDHKTQDPAGRGTVVVDNIAYMIEANNGSQIAQQDHNMVRAGAATGDFIGTPTYAGGSTPTTPAGFLLAAGSAGIGRASDGTNVGIR